MAAGVVGPRGQAVSPTPRRLAPRWPLATAAAVSAERAARAPRRRQRPGRRPRGLCGASQGWNLRWDVVRPSVGGETGLQCAPARRRGRLPRRPPERRHGSRKPPGRHRRRTGRGTSPAAAGSRWELRRGVVAPASTGRRGRVGAARANGGGALSGGGGAATGSEGRPGTAWRREAAGAGPAAPRTRRTARHRAGGSVGVSLDLD